MNTIQILNIILVIVLLIVVILAFVAVFIIFKIRNSKEKKIKEQKIEVQSNEKERKKDYITRSGVGIDSIYKFMEFDEIVDNMIVRKNAKQYVMVMECKGINYDLLSEEEKNAVELGFIEMLNTLHFPIQLYVQTRTLNLDDTIKKYTKRTDEIRNQINKLNARRQMAINKGDTQQVNILSSELKKKQNILEYGESIENYTMKISGSKNILQQKTYVIVSYYPSEYGDISKYSKEEINDIAFSELYTRSQTLIRALSAAEVSAKVLSSEQLAELLYVAYNRDESENYRLKDALDADYGRLYSTAKDVMEEKKKNIEAQVEKEATKLAANSIIKADQISREERAKRVKERANQMVDQYKNSLSKPLYEETKRQIEKAKVGENNNNNIK